MIDIDGKNVQNGICSAKCLDTHNNYHQIGDTRQNIIYSYFIHNLYNGDWNDSGVLHIDEDGDTEKYKAL